MTVELLHHTPLWVAAKAIRKCWASEGKSDTEEVQTCPECFSTDCNCGAPVIWSTVCGPNDRALIERVGNKFKHASTLEHLVYTFDILGVSRGLLQEQMRTRIASPSVESSRYTLAKFMKEFGDVREYLVQTGDQDIDNLNAEHMTKLQALMNSKPIANDIAKYAIVEAYKTNLTWTINARSLQNFLTLRSSKAALREIRDLANAIYEAIPTDHKYLFEECFVEKTTITKAEYKELLAIKANSVHIPAFEIEQ